MAQEINAVEEPQAELTPEEVSAQIIKFRDSIVRAAVENQLSFDVVFNALSQTAASFIFDFLLVTQGEVDDDNLQESVNRFNEQTDSIAKLGLKNMREYVRKQQANAVITAEEATVAAEEVAAKA